MRTLNSSLKYFIVQKLKLSNKEAIQHILSGSVLVNGKPGSLTQALFAEDEVMLNDQTIKVPRKGIYIAYHKPYGIESTMNASIAHNLLQAVDIPEQVHPIGRLDKASEGLMLLTNDGKLSINILHPKSCHEKEYRVTVDHPLTQLAIDQLTSGIIIMGKMTRPALVRQLNETTFIITLTQGLNRQIRRMCYKLGYEVTKLVRIRFISIELGNLLPGEWRYLGQDETGNLIREVSSVATS